MTASQSTKTKNKLLIICLLIILSGLSQHLVAQACDHKADHYSLDSTKGYWRIKTHIATRATGIRFYAPDHRLLYEETLPEKWVKLTRRNQHQFDKLLAQLIANQLLASRIKTETLPTLLPEPTITAESTLSGTVTNPLETTEWTVHAFINQSGKLRVLVDNPANRQYSIELVDKAGRSLYREYTTNNRYRRWLDLSELVKDTHNLTIRIDNRAITYQVTNRSARLVYPLQPLAAQQP